LRGSETVRERGRGRKRGRGRERERGEVALGMPIKNVDPVDIRPKMEQQGQFNISK
jgi:hypothetical protein